MKLKISPTFDCCKLPARAHANDAALDAYATHDALLMPFEPVAVGLGFSVEVPEGYGLLVCSRSGLALKEGVVVANSPGLVDPGYRGEVKAILVSVSGKPYAVKAGDRICQVRLVESPSIEWDIVDELAPSDRSVNGFGSTGV